MSDLRRFFHHSAVYTVGNLIYRGASFLLVPLYAHMLTPTEFGVLEILTVTATIFQGLFSSGMAHSALRFYFEYDEPRERHRVISTALIASFALASTGAAVLWFLAPLASRLLFASPVYVVAFRIAFVSIVLEISREISLAVVRAKERSVFFIVLSIVQLVAQVGASLYTVVYLRLGPVGVLAANLVATSIVWAVLTVYTVRMVGLGFDFVKLRAIVRYAYPLMLNSVTAPALGSVDRFLLKSTHSLAATGVYALALRLAQVIPVLIGDPFQKSFGPFRFSIMKQPNAQQVYARILTYYVLVACSAVVGIVAFGPEIVRLVAAATFGEASGILALVLLPGAISGATYVFQTGIYIEKATRNILFISTATGVIGLAANVLLIPRFGMYGAGTAAALASVCGLVLTWVFSQRLYPVAYRLGADTSLVALTAVAILATRFVPQEPLWLRLGLKVAVVSAQVVLGARIAGLRAGDFRDALARLRQATPSPIEPS